MNEFQEMLNEEAWNILQNYFEEHYDDTQSSNATSTDSL